MNQVTEAINKQDSADLQRGAGVGVFVNCGGVMVESGGTSVGNGQPVSQGVAESWSKGVGVIEGVTSAQPT